MYILVDVGGTKMRLAKSEDLSTFGEPLITHTPSDYKELIQHLTSTAKALANGGRIDGMMIGKPLWKALSTFEHDVKARVDAPLRIENDAALVGLGEATHGAGRGAKICVYITVSTGVNGVRIVDGMIDPSRQGFEIGDQYLLTGDRPQTLEDLVSGTAVSMRYSVASPVDLGKDNPAWEELARTLAFGIHNTIAHWSPDSVVLGGSMFNDVGISIERVKAYVSQINKKFPSVPNIVHAELHDLGGLWGGMERLRQLR